MAKFIIIPKILLKAWNHDTRTSQHPIGHEVRSQSSESLMGNHYLLYRHWGNLGQLWLSNVEVDEYLPSSE